jgi:hypothetical protein
VRADIIIVANSGLTVYIADLGDNIPSSRNSCYKFNATIYLSPNSIRRKVMRTLTDMFKHFIPVRGFIKRLSVKEVEFCFLWNSTDPRSHDIIRMLSQMLYKEFGVIKADLSVEPNCTDPDILVLLTKPFVLMNFAGNNPALSEEDLYDDLGVHAEVKSRGSLDSLHS